MIEGMTPTEAAERLGVPPTTLVTWLDELPIPRRADEVGHAWIDEEALAVLEAVRGMRAYDLGFQTIRRHLEALDGPVEEAEDLEPPANLGAAVEGAEAPTAAMPAEPPVATAPAEPPVATAPAEPPSAVLAAPAAPALDAAAIAAAVTAALAPLIGALTDQQAAQARELTAQARLIGQLEADNAFVRRDRDQLTGELVEARRRMAFLEARIDLLQAPTRPWWRFWA